MKPTVILTPENAQGQGQGVWLLANGHLVLLSGPGATHWRARPDTETWDLRQDPDQWSYIKQRYQVTS